MIFSENRFPLFGIMLWAGRLSAQKRPLARLRPEKGACEDFAARRRHLKVWPKLLRLIGLVSGNKEINHIDDGIS